MQITFSASEASTDNFSFVSEVSVDCVLSDGGLFTLPATAVAELHIELGSGWTLEIDDFSRTLYIVQQKGDSVPLVLRSN